MDKKAKIKITSTRPGEKIHEILCAEGEIRNTYKRKSFLTIYPENFPDNEKKGKLVSGNFNYTSNAKDCLNKNKIEKLVKKIIYR